MHSDVPTDDWQGRLSDGQTARSETVTVRLTAGGLEITGTGSPTLHAYDTLTSASPVTASASDVLLSVAEQPGASLFVSGADFVRHLATRAPGLTASAQRWKTTRPILVVVALILAGAATLWALDVSPAKGIASLMPDRVRQGLGDSVVASMVGNRRECTNPAGRKALDKLTARLSAASGSPRSFSVRVVDWKLINAFATPGERIVMTSEIIAKAISPDEIAGILAHEMGHGIELHPEAGIVRAIGLTAAMELLLGSGTISNLGLTLAQIQYTRAGEREADHHALRILKQASISTAGIVAFFERLDAIERTKSKKAKTNGKPDNTKTDSSASDVQREALALFRTHPVSEERAKLAAAQAGYPTTPALSAADWEALRAICPKPSKAPAPMEQ